MDSHNSETEKLDLSSRIPQSAKSTCALFGYWFTTVLLLSLFGCNWTNVGVKGVDVVESGIFEIPSAVKDKQAIQGVDISTAKAYGPPKLLTATDEIPARVGIVFGISFIAQGDRQGEKVNMAAHVVHPPLKKPSGQIADGTEKIPIECKTGEIAAYCFMFEEDWEAVPGPWSIQIWYQGKKMAHRDFLVKKVEEN